VTLSIEGAARAVLVRRRRRWALPSVRRVEGPVEEILVEALGGDRCRLVLVRPDGTRARLTPAIGVPAKRLFGLAHEAQGHLERG
jgi:hypothetical protein